METLFFFQFGAFFRLKSYLLFETIQEGLFGSEFVEFPHEHLEQRGDARAVVQNQARDLKKSFIIYKSEGIKKHIFWTIFSLSKFISKLAELKLKNSFKKTSLVLRLNIGRRGNLEDVQWICGEEGRTADWLKDALEKIKLNFPQI